MFAFFQKAGRSIDEGFADFQREKDAVLLDVRTPQEYARGHLEGSVNLPLGSLAGIRQTVPDRGKILYVYCQSGARSRQAVEYLRCAGYGRAKDIGGINDYHGKVIQ